MTTRYDPSPDDPRVRAALAAREELDAAFQRHDAETVKRLAAADVIVNAPINRVVDLSDAVRRFNSREIDYTSVTVNLEFAGARGDLVVLMGEEVVTPAANAPHANKTVRRRFTDVWRAGDAGYRLVVRQATITSVE